MTSSTTGRTAFQGIVVASWITVSIESSRAPFQWFSGMPQLAPSGLSLLLIGRRVSQTYRQAGVVGKITCMRCMHCVRRLWFSDHPRLMIKVVRWANRSYPTSHHRPKTIDQTVTAHFRVMPYETVPPTLAGRCPGVTVASGRSRGQRRWSGRGPCPLAQVQGSYVEPHDFYSGGVPARVGACTPL